MNIEPDVITAMAGLLVVFGGGAKWLLMRTDEKNRLAAAEQTELRVALSDRLHDEIRILRQDITRLQNKESLYLRRIYQLENHIHKHPDIEVPDLEGWPPA